MTTPSVYLIKLIHVVGRVPKDHLSTVAVLAVKSQCRKYRSMQHLARYHRPSTEHCTSEIKKTNTASVHAIQIAGSSNHQKTGTTVVAPSWVRLRSMGASDGARHAAVAQKSEEDVDDEGPEVAGELRAGDEDAPEDD